MIKQAVLYKLATLRLAVNYVLRRRMTKQAADPRFRQRPTRPEFDRGDPYAGKITTPNNMNSGVSAKSFSAPPASNIPTPTPKPVQQPKPVYPASKMTYQNGQYFGKGSINNWGNQIAEERNRLNNIYNNIYSGGTAAQKAKWDAAYKQRLDNLNALESKWNSYNEAKKNLTPMVYNAQTNQYYGRGNASTWGAQAQAQRNVLNQAYSMLSPEQQKYYNQRIEALNKFDNQYKPVQEYLSNENRFRYNPNYNISAGDTSQESLDQYRRANEAVYNMLSPDQQGAYQATYSKRLAGTTPDRIASSYARNAYIPAMQPRREVPLDHSKVRTWLNLRATKLPKEEKEYLDQYHAEQDAADREYWGQYEGMMDNMAGWYTKRLGITDPQLANSINNNMHTIGVLMSQGMNILDNSDYDTSRWDQSKRMQYLLNADQAYAAEGHKPGDYIATIAANMQDISDNGWEPAEVPNVPDIPAVHVPF